MISGWLRVSLQDQISGTLNFGRLSRSCRSGKESGTFQWLAECKPDTDREVPLQRGSTAAGLVQCCHSRHCVIAACSPDTVRLSGRSRGPAKTGSARALRPPSDISARKCAEDREARCSPARRLQKLA